MLLTFLAVSAIYGYLFYNQVEVEAIPALVDPNGPPKFSRMIYGGFGEEALKKPMDVAVIGQFIYVTDTNNHRVQVFDTGGTPIFKFGKQGDGPGEFQFPYGIAGDNKGNVYVADLYNGGISVHDSKGKFIKYFAEKKPAEKTIETPGGLRIIDNKVYVTDITKSKVYVFDMEGKKLLEIGKMGIKEGELRAPNAVTADKEGNIYVVDTGNQRVQVFDKKGKFLRIINGSPDGKGPSQFVNPRGIGIDSRGIVYVVSNLTHFVHGFDREGNQVFTFGGNGSANDQFSLPNGLFITENDEVLITDTVNQRIAVYE
ncbi:6-bladed beta-propeller [Thermincola ferriacetica]|nr:6-bladed beta-propeller [Thermincola ferriacetica]